HGKGPKCGDWLRQKRSSSARATRSRRAQREGSKNTCRGTSYHRWHRKRGDAICDGVGKAFKEEVFNVWSEFVPRNSYCRSAVNPFVAPRIDARGCSRRSFSGIRSYLESQCEPDNLALCDRVVADFSVDY